MSNVNPFAAMVLDNRDGSYTGYWVTITLGNYTVNLTKTVTRNGVTQDVHVAADRYKPTANDPGTKTKCCPFGVPGGFNYPSSPWTTNVKPGEPSTFGMVTTVRTMLLLLLLELQLLQLLLLLLLLLTSLLQVDSSLRGAGDRLADLEGKYSTVAGEKSSVYMKSYDLYGNDNYEVGTMLLSWCCSCRCAGCCSCCCSGCCTRCCYCCCSCADASPPPVAAGVLRHAAARALEDAVARRRDAGGGG